MPKGLYDRDRRSPRTKSGLKGVQYLPVKFITQDGQIKTVRKPWRAYATRYGQQISLGYFTTKWEAAKAYNEWAIKVYGPGTWLNPVPSKIRPVSRTRSGMDSTE